MYSTQLFESDSTYCSIPANTNKVSQKRKCRSQKLQSCRPITNLDEIHKKIIHHWKGKELMQKDQVEQYIRQLSKIKFKTYREQGSAKRIQLCLSKIHKSLSLFEITLSQSERSNLQPDPIENCLPTQDLKVQDENASYDPKQFLIDSENKIDQQSFPLEIFTRDDFLISSSNNKTIADSGTDKSSSQAYMIEETANSQDLFYSQSIVSTQDYYVLQSSSKSSENTHHHSQFSNIAENIPQKRRCVLDISGNIATEEFIFPPSSENFVESSVPSNKIYEQFYPQKSDVPLSRKVKIPQRSVKCDSSVVREDSSNIIEATEETRSSVQDIAKIDEIINETSVRNSGHDDILEILNNSIVKEGFFKSDTEQRVGIAENNLTTNYLKMKNPKEVVELSNTFHEAYSNRIDKISRHSTDDDLKVNFWNEAENEIERVRKVAKEVNDSLKGLFDKLSVTQEKRINENQPEYNYWFDKFSLEDREKFVVDEFVALQRPRLEEISEKFKETIKKSKSLVKTVKHNVQEYENFDWHEMFEQHEAIKTKNNE